MESTENPDRVPVKCKRQGCVPEEVMLKLVLLSAGRMGQESRGNSEHLRV